MAYRQKQESDKFYIFGNTPQLSFDDIEILNSIEFSKDEYTARADNLGCLKIHFLIPIDEVIKRLRGHEKTS